MNGYIYALFTALLWGAGFIGSKYGLEELGAMWVTFARFLIALIVCLPTIFWIKKANISKQLLVQTFICSSFLVGIMFFQIKGLEYTTVAKSGFITILYVFFTPIIGYLIFKTKITKIFIALLALAFIGILLLLDLNMTNLNRGDFYTLLCALFSACHLVALSKLSKNTEDIFLFNILQLTFVSLLSLPLAIILEGTQTPLELVSNYQSHIPTLLSLGFMGVFSTALAFLLQIKTQKTLSAHKAGLIYLLESPFAVILGFILLGESLSQRSIIGCTIVLTAVALIPFEQALKHGFPRLKYEAIKLAYTALNIIK